LDAAADVFSQVGYDAATTENIAAQAETSIGSLYQFFPNKRVLFGEVARISLDRFRGKYETLITDDAIRGPWPELIEMAIDGFADLQFTDPYVRAVATNVTMWGDFATEDVALQKALIQAAQGIVQLHAPALERQQLHLAAAMIVHTISVMMYIAWREPEGMRPAIITETKRMLVRYLAPMMDS